MFRSIKFRLFNRPRVAVALALPVLVAGIFVASRMARKEADAPPLAAPPMMQTEAIESPPAASLMTQEEGKENDTAAGQGEAVKALAAQHVVTDVLLDAVTGKNFDVSHQRETRWLLEQMRHKDPLHPRLNTTLAALYEVNGEVEKAQAHYLLAARVEAQSEHGRRAAGALRRLHHASRSDSQGEAEAGRGIRTAIAKGGRAFIDKIASAPALATLSPLARAEVRVCRGDDMAKVASEEFPGSPGPFHDVIRCHLDVISSQYKRSELVHRAHALHQKNPSSAADLYAEASRIAPEQPWIAHAAFRCLWTAKRYQNAAAYVAEMKSRNVPFPEVVDKALAHVSRPRPAAPQTASRKPASKSASKPKPTSSKPSLSDQFLKRIGK